VRTRTTAVQTALTGLTAASLLAGCISRPRPPAAPEPFVFRSLDLRQQTGTGEPAWDLSSPEARYDLIRQLALAREPRGTIYRQGQRSITIQARRGTVIGDGQAIQLEGDVQITLLGRNPVQITGDQARWIPRQNLMVIDRRPAARDRRSRITSQTARYRLDRDLVELRGAPVLEQWAQRQGQASIRVQVSSVDWKPQQGDLMALGPVLGQRFSAKAQPQRPAAAPEARRPADLRLRSSGLRGNLRQGFIDLLEPVQVRDGNGSSWLNARRTRWAINEEWLGSDQPFEGAMKALQARGNGLRINLANDTVLVPEACVLTQPGEQLSARRCLWNWSSGRFDAEGSVLLRRQAYQQVTRASRLQGRIGKDGTAVFTNPGARVESRFTLPPQGAGRAPKAAAAPPVTF
jgi:LPS export ABC transporter protein LptC